MICWIISVTGQNESCDQHDSHVTSRDLEPAVITVHFLVCLESEAVSWKNIIKLAKRPYINQRSPISLNEKKTHDTIDFFNS